MTLLACPSCWDATELTELFQIPAQVSVVAYRNEHGAKTESTEPRSDVDYDSQKLVGGMCSSCGWQHDDADWLEHLGEMPSAPFLVTAALTVVDLGAIPLGRKVAAAASALRQTLTVDQLDPRVKTIMAAEPDRAGKTPQTPEELTRLCLAVEDEGPTA